MTPEEGSIKVWVVLQANGNDGDDVVAVYANEQFANAHAEELGCWVSEADVLNALVSEVTDPERKAERQASIERGRREWEERKRVEAEEDRRASEVRPHERMSLCRCQVYTPTYDWINPHGYCTFCGGFTIAAFRGFKGEEALQSAIDDFAKHDRERLRAKAAILLPPKEI